MDTIKSYEENLKQKYEDIAKVNDINKFMFSSKK